MPPAKSLLWLAATLIAAFFAEAALFRQGWYYKYVETRFLRRLRRTPPLLSQTLPPCPR